MAEIHDPREATLVVAASDSLTKSADYRCDGTADEVQINAAIAALGGAGRVLLLDGTYTIADDDAIDLVSNLVIEGQGETTVLAKTVDGTDDCLFLASTGSGPYTDVTIKNLKIDAGSPTGVATVVNIWDVDNLKLDNVYCVSGNQKGKIYIRDCNYIKIINCYFDGYTVQCNGDEAGHIGDDAYINSIDAIVQDCTFVNSSTTTFALGNLVKGFRIIGNYFSGGFNAIDTYISPDTVIADNVIYNSSSKGIYIEAARYVTITGNTINGNDTTPYGINVAHQVDIAQATPGKVDISNNIILDVLDAGILVEGTERVSIIGNIVSGCDKEAIFLATKTPVSTTYYSHYCLIKNNYVFDFGNTAWKKGILLDTNAGDYCVIEGNYIDGNSNANISAGIMIEAGSDYANVKGNTIRACTTAFLDAGTLTEVWDDNDGITITDVKMFNYVKNTSGGELAAGDVCIIKKVAAGNEINTTTVEGDQLVFGMVAETIANAAWGLVQVKGKTTLLKVDGSANIAIGDLIGCFTTAKIGMKAAAGKMAFAIALEAYETDDSAGVIDALIICPRQAI